MASPSSFIELAGVRVALSARLPDERLLMVLGGRAPAPAWLSALARGLAAEVWAVDSGADACRAAGLRPGVLIGDGDSASAEAWRWAVEGGAAEARYASAKDLTDFQLALDRWRGDVAARRRMPVVTGCFGGRLDHLFSSLHSFSAARPRSTLVRCMIDDREGVFLLYSGEEAAFAFRERPLAISLLPLSGRCGGVSIDGVRWPLKGAELERRLPWAISNELLEAEGAGEGGAGCCTVSCGRGVLGVYWCGREGE